MRLTFSKITALITLALCIAGAISYGYFRSTTKIASPEKKWEVRIDAVGASAAYLEFIKQMDALPAPVQHLQAHYFGEALYKQEGASGVALCDDRFLWGCFHQLIGMAIADHGETIIPDLRASCATVVKSIPNTCIHAIGHGLLAYAGYTAPDLDEAITMCAPVTNIAESSVSECFKGAYMEFNTRRMLGEDGTLRPMTDNDPYYPCDGRKDVEEARACYYVAPTWWWGLIKTENKLDPNSPNSYALYGERCARLSSAVIRKACYQGIGSLIGWEALQKPESRPALCEVVSTDATDQYWCKTELAAIMNMNKLYPPEKTCAGQSTNFYEQCVAKAQKSSVIH